MIVMDSLIFITGYNMSDAPSKRQRQILDKLQTEPLLTIPELVEWLRVSAMTVHRDLNQLATAGLVIKTRGGVELPAHNAAGSAKAAGCGMCGGEVHARTAFTVQNQQGNLIRACCAHCGLLLLQLTSGAKAAFTNDFIHDRVVDARGAIYLIESQVSLCCVPSILSFLNVEEAHGFRCGFGGTVMDYAEIQHHLQHVVTTPEG
jgi:DeoR family transcriptional regulator, copper-sensing transcriptional repressor